MNVQVTDNFEHNLESIRCYFHQHSQQAFFDALLDKLFDVIIPNIQSHPMIGLEFLAQSPDSLEVLRKVECISAKLPKHASIRQYNDQDYTLLYVLHGDDVGLLAIKHQRQLAFDFGLVE